MKRSIDLDLKSSQIFFLVAVNLFWSMSPVLAHDTCPKREVVSSESIGQFKYDLEKCFRQSGKVICQGWVTATEKDSKSAVIENESQIVDLSGNRYTQPTANFGGKDTWESDVFKDVPSKFILTYKDIPESVKKLAIVSVHFYESGRIIFRNIEIGKASLANSPAEPSKKKK
jgi:hypothetical protein